MGWKEIGGPLDAAATGTTATLFALVRAVLALFTVPVQDAATDVSARDVVGKKSDTVAGTSLMARLKNLQAAILVPAIDAVTNLNARDVVGNKSDTVGGTSVVALLKQAAALFTVPLADAVANVVTRDVVGNKTDTVAGDSVIALIKQLIAARLVPGADAADNTDGFDVIGNKTDTIAGDSLVALQKQALSVLRGAGQITYRPLAASGDTVTGHANPWTVGNWVEIFAAGEVLVDVILCGVAIDTPSDGAIVGSIDVSYGAANTIVAQGLPLEVASDASLMVLASLPPSRIIPAGNAIYARLQTAAGGAESVGVKLGVRVA